MTRRPPRSTLPLPASLPIKGNVTQFACDELNRQYQTTYADGSSTLLSFDADDNVIVQRDNNGLRMLYHVDPLSRRTRMDLDKTDRKSTRLNSSHLVISYAVF